MHLVAKGCAALLRAKAHEEAAAIVLEEIVRYLQQMMASHPRGQHNDKISDRRGALLACVEEDLVNERQRCLSEPTGADGRQRRRQQQQQQHNEEEERHAVRTTRKRRRAT